MFCVCKVWHKFQSIHFMLYLLFSESGLTHKGDGIFPMLSKIYMFSEETETGIEISTFHTSVKSHATSSPQTSYQIYPRYCSKNTFLIQIMYCSAPTIKENVGFLLYALKRKQPTQTPLYLD